jgi:peroxiredoxin
MAVPDAVGDARVIDPRGESVRLASLWAAQPCMLVFLRHFGCIGCSEQLHELVPRLGEIARAGVRVVLIGSGSPEQRDAFVERHLLQNAPATVMTDPGLDAYGRLHFARSLWATFGPRAIVDAARAVAKGHPHAPPQGDRMQQGGVLFVDTRGVVRFFHASRSIGDHPPASDLVAAALRLAIETHSPRAYV